MHFHVHELARQSNIKSLCTNIINVVRATELIRVAWYNFNGIYTFFESCDEAGEWSKGDIEVMPTIISEQKQGNMGHYIVCRNAGWN